MAENRLVLYGSAIVVASALMWMGFIKKHVPDVGTLVRSADLSIRMAGHLPKAIDGKPNPLRKKILGEAADSLKLAEESLRAELRAGTQDDQLQTGDALASVLEFQAYGRVLSGEFQLAIEFYNEAAVVTGCVPSRYRRIHFSLADLYLERGRPECSLEALARLKKQRMGLAEEAKVELLRAAALRMQGASCDDVALALQAAGAAQPDNADVQLTRAKIYEETGLRDLAGSCYERAALEHPRAYLPLARLKFQAGDVEGALNALLCLAQKDLEFLRAKLPLEKGMKDLAEDPRLRAILAGTREEK